MSKQFAITPESIKELRNALKIGDTIKITEPSSLYVGGHPEKSEGTIIGKYKNLFIIECNGLKKAFKYVALLQSRTKWEIIKG